MSTGAEVVVRSLIAHGAKHVFGVPGDTSIDWYDALRTARGRIRHVVAADERHAGYMADAYARLTNRPGICEGPSGGGVTYMLPGVGEANRSSIPLIALNTGVPLRTREKGMLTEIDQDAVYRTETKWAATIPDVRRIPEMMAWAFRTATAGRPGAVHLALPMDVMAQDADGVADLRSTTDARCPADRTIPSQEALDQASDALQSVARLVIVAGGGVHLSSAYDELIELAERTGGLVGTSLTGKGAFPETHPLSIGCIGENGARPPANRAVEAADVLFYVGSEMGSVVTSKWTLPAPTTRQRILRLDIDIERMGRNYPTAIGLAGDARETLRALNRTLEARAIPVNGERRAFGQEIRREIEKWLAGIDFKNDASPIRSARLVADLKAVLPGNAIVVSDPGTPTPSFAAYYEFDAAGRRYINPRAHGALGYAIPGAVGAKIACPDATVVGLTGDGSALMSIGELATVSRLGMPMTLIVFHNNEYGWIRASQHFGKGVESYGVEFSDSDYAAIAEGFGIKGVRVRRTDEFLPALRAACDADIPTLIDVRTAPLVQDVPPVAPWEAAAREPAGWIGPSAEPVAARERS